MTQEMETKMIKRILMVVGLLSCSAMARASGMASFDVGYSTWSQTNITCTTGTAIDVSAFPTVAGSTWVYSTVGAATTTMRGFQPARYRFESSNSPYDVFLGPDSNVSTSSTSVFMGQKLVGTSTGTAREFFLGWNPDQNQPVKIFCIAQEGAGAFGVKILRTIFGYK